MDPDATFKAMLDHLGAGDLGEAAKASEALAYWLHKGGKVPDDLARVTIFRPTILAQRFWGMAKGLELLDKVANYDPWEG